MNLPCLITAIRIIATLSIMFITPFSDMFYVIYILAGLSDALDGFIARKTNQITELGGKLDSAADIFFYAVSIIKILPALWNKLPVGIWFAVGAAVIVRLASYAIALVKYKCFSSLHTYMNKITGFLVFIVPITFSMEMFLHICIVVCAVAFLSSFEELLIHIFSKDYNCEVKTFFKVKKNYSIS